MSDESAAHDAGADLTSRIASLLDSLGGRSAVAAQRFGPALGRDLPVVPSQTGRPDDAGRQPDADATETRGDLGAPARPARPARVEQASAVSIRADEVFPAASLAKLPIAIELMRRQDMGQFDLNERFDTSSQMRVGGAGVLDFLNLATQLTLAELCTLMLIVSDNTASNFLLDLVGMGEVNETLSRLNLKRTTLARHFMDANARASGRDNLTSAADMLTLIGLIRGNALPGGRRLREMLAEQQSFRELTEGWLPASATLAHKDGTMDDVVNETGIISGPGGVAMYCILTAEQQDIPAARTAVGRIIRLLWDSWRLG